MKVIKRTVLQSVFITTGLIEAADTDTPGMQYLTIVRWPLFHAAPIRLKTWGTNIDDAFEGHESVVNMVKEILRNEFLAGKGL